MRKNFFISMLALVALCFSACCSDCNKCCNKEASECSKKRAKHCTEMLTERLELTAEQAESVEKLMINKFETETRERKAFFDEMEKILGAEKFEAFKAVSKDCHSKRPCHAAPAKGCCKGEKPCVKSDSCKTACDKPACCSTENQGCPKSESCQKKCPNQ